MTYPSELSLGAGSEEPPSYLFHVAQKVITPVKECIFNWQSVRLATGCFHVAYFDLFYTEEHICSGAGHPFLTSLPASPSLALFLSLSPLCLFLTVSPYLSLYLCFPLLLLSLPPLIRMQGTQSEGESLHSGSYSQHLILSF